MSVIIILTLSVLFPRAFDWKLTIKRFFINLICYFLAAVTTTEPEKTAVVTITSKKRDVHTSVISTPERHNHVENSQDRSRQRVDDTAYVDDRQTSSTKKDTAVHAAKRKKLARNDKLIGNDEFDVTDRKPIPTTDTSAKDRKSIETKDAPDRSEISTKSVSERLLSPTPVEKPRNDVVAVIEKNKTDHVTSEKPDVDVDVPSVATTGSSSVAEKADDKDRADVLDDVDDDVADTFALFAQMKSTSGARKTTDKELPVSQPQQPAPATSRTDSYDQLSTGGGATLAMADSGYQTYDHDLSALDDRQSQAVPDNQTPAAKPEVTSELELQSSISEPDMADTVARYSASSDSEISVELPSCASSSGADKPTSFDWQLPQAASATHDETSLGDEIQTRKVARRASEEDIEQTRSAILCNLWPSRRFLALVDRLL